MSSTTSRKILSDFRVLVWKNKFNFKKRVASAGGVFDGEVILRNKRVNGASLALISPNKEGVIELIYNIYLLSES